jgi:ornithine decarboxylase
MHAHKLGLDVVGVSFHIGSGAANPHIFYDALRQAREVVEMGRQIGYDMHIIDIGGGFSVKNITGMASSIHKAIADFFPDAEDFDFIAEPGRYFAETIGTLYTKIVGVRERRGHRDYFITDSVYGSFNCIFYDHCQLVPEPVIRTKEINLEHTVPSTLFGPTCDGADKVIDRVDLPRLEYGDWLRWRNMGAYTIAGACDFNGINFTTPHIIYL